MSRALFIALDEDKVIASCRTEKVGISAIERLPNGGVRLVCMSSNGAAWMQRKLKRHLIDGAVTRVRYRPSTPIW